MAKSRFTRREKAVLALLPISVVIMGSAFLLRGPLAAYRESKDVLAAAQERLRTSEVIRDQVLGEQQSLREFMASLPKIDTRPLLTIVNETLNEVNLNQKEKATISNNVQTSIRSAASSLDTVQLSLKGVSLDELITVCYTLQQRCGILIVEQMTNLGPAPDEQGLNVDLRISKVRVSGPSAVPVSPGGGQA